MTGNESIDHVLPRRLRLLCESAQSAGGVVCREQYDYYAVPSFFDGKKKLFEAHLFMSYENIRDEIRRVLDYSLTETSVGSQA